MLLTVSLLLAAACVIPAAGKLLGHSHMRLAAEHFGIGWRRYQLIGTPNWPPPLASSSGWRGARLGWPPPPG